MKTRLYTITCQCPMCGKEFVFELTETEMEMYEEYLYERKHLIQDVFPNRTAAERELLREQGGVCGECWNKMFSFFE